MSVSSNISSDTQKDFKFRNVPIMDRVYPAIQKEPSKVEDHASTARYVVEVELDPTPQQRALIEKRIRVTCQFYNVMIKELQKRYNRMLCHPSYRAFLKATDSKQRSEYFNHARKECGLGHEYALASRVAEIRNSASRNNSDNIFFQHLSVHTAHALANRAFDVWDKYLNTLTYIPKKKKALGEQENSESEATSAKAKDTSGSSKKNSLPYKYPRFKSYRNYMSIPSTKNEGLCVKAEKKKGVVVDDVKLHWGTSTDKKYKCVINLKINPFDDFHNYTFAYDNNNHLVFRDPEGPCVTKIVKRTIRGKNRYFVQMTMKGLSPIIYRHDYANDGLVGIDLGVQSLGVVTDTQAKLLRFCTELDLSEGKLTLLQQKLDRQRRANNPGNYNPDGTCKRSCDIGKIAKAEGRPMWVISKSEKHIRQQYAEIKRKQQDYRKVLHGRLVNEICKTGINVAGEEVNVRAWQAHWGKAIGNRAPGMFQELLKRRVNTLGGNFYLFKTNTTALSQTCACGHKVEKTLGDRVHICPSCGIEMQRDLMSAFLARYVKSIPKDQTEITKVKRKTKKDDTMDVLDITSANNAYPAFKDMMTDVWDKSEVNAPKRRIIVR